MEDANVNEFELQRQQLIARNRARLLALGIPEAVSGLAKLAPKQAQHKKRKAPRAAAAEPAAPSRQSTRLRDQAMVARGEVPPDVEQGSELALFIIDGECPRCGKVLSSGHARHLQSCRGPPEPPTDEEIAAQAEAYKSQQKDKLRQLELGGLVDYQPAAHIQQQQQQQDEQASPAKRRRTAGDAGVAEQQQEALEEAGTEGESNIQQQRQQQKGKGKQSTSKSTKAAAKKKHGTAPAAAAAAAAGDEQADGAHATFIVIGSTGSHYVVKLDDAKRSCTCMDHRMRRRDCKHIRLILEQLAVADAPQDWEQALQRMVSDLAAAEPADVAMVRQAEARAAARKEKAAAAAAAAEQQK